MEKIIFEGKIFVCRRKVDDSLQFACRWCWGGAADENGGFANGRER